MKHRPITTITFFLLSLAVTLIAPTFDSSFYGVNGHPTEWLSFMPGAPLRHMGLSLIFSPLLHINVWHLITSLIVLAPVALMMERKKSGFFLALNFCLIHFQVLLFLVWINMFYPMEGKAFLGSSHVVIGLYTFWSLANKKYGMLSIPLIAISIDLWNSNSLTLLAHTLGFVVGVEILLLGRLWNKVRPQSAN